MRKVRLGIDAEGIRDAVDVIEVGNDLDGVVDFGVRPAGHAQVGDVLSRAVRRRVRHSFGMD